MSLHMLMHMHMHTLTHTHTHIYIRYISVEWRLIETTIETEERCMFVVQVFRCIKCIFVETSLKWLCKTSRWRQLHQQNRGLKVVFYAMLAHWPVSSFSARSFFFCFGFLLFSFHFVSLHFTIFILTSLPFATLCLVRLIVCVLFPFLFFFCRASLSLSYIQFLFSCDYLFFYYRMYIGFPFAVHLYQFVWHLKCVVHPRMVYLVLHDKHTIFQMWSNVFRTNTHAHYETNVTTAITTTTSKQIHKIIL